MSHPQSLYHRWPNAAAGDGPLVFTSTRQGGVSRGCFASLNIGRHVGDDDGAVTDNRGRLLAAHGLEPAQLALCSQTHSTTVTPATAGGGTLDASARAPEADGIATNTSGLGVGIMTADCVPVLLWAREQRAVAAVHAGRVGLYDGIIVSALQVLSCQFAADPADVRAIVGPSIGPCCYEVSPELAEAFRERFGANVAAGRQLDLWSAAARALTEAGVPASSIGTEMLCTSCDPDRFFSHRRDGGRTGRMVSVVVAP
jgi:polyphenol oxidase